MTVVESKKEISGLKRQDEKGKGQCKDDSSRKSTNE